jgi:hypothetical protein
MKHLKIITLIIILSLGFSCGFFSKGEKEGKKSLLEIGKQLVKEAKKQQKKYKSDMDVEITANNKEKANKVDAKTLRLKEKHFEVALKNLDSSINQLEKLNKDIEEKTKDGEISTFEAFALIGKVASLGTGYSSEYIDKNFEGQEKEEMKTAFSKIMSMYMIDSGIKGNKEIYSKENMENLIKMKKQMENLDNNKAEKEKAMKDIEEMQQQMKKMEEYAKNPLKDYSEEDVKQFEEFKPQLDKKIKTIKSLLKKMGDKLK